MKHLAPLAVATDGMEAKRKAVAGKNEVKSVFQAFLLHGGTCVARFRYLVRRQW